MRLIALLFVAATACALSAETIEGMGGQLKLDVPKDWEKAETRSRIIEHEFTLPGEPGKEDDVRLTMMPAGGSVKANIERWKGQFTGGEAKPVEEFSVGNRNVHFVEINGTFSERMGGGPFAGGRVVTRPDYAMLGAIIVEGDGSTGGKYFIKATGPKQAIAKQKEAVKKMLKSVKAE